MEFDNLMPERDLPSLDASKGKAPVTLEFLTQAIDSLDWALILFESTPANETPLTLLFANAAFETLTGRKPSELSRQGWELLLLEQTQSQRFQQMQESARQGYSDKGEFLLECSDQTRFWASLEFLPCRHSAQTWAVVIRDVSDQIRRRQERQVEQQRLQASLQHLSEAVFALDGEGKIVFANRRAEELTGLWEGASQGKPVQQVLHLTTNDGQRWEALPVDAVLAGVSAWQCPHTLRIESRARASREVHVRLTPVLDSSRRATGGVLLLQEVGSAASTSGKASTKVDTAAVLSHGIAHDFNNLLTGILGNLSLARKQLEEPDRTQALLVSAEKAAVRAQDLCRQLMAFHRGNAPVKTRFSLRSLLREAVGFTVNASPCRARTVIAEDLPEIDADEGQISQVLNNILINATQAMPDGGSITIEADTVRDPNGLTPGDYVEIGITDSGPGIPEDVIGRIFEPYFTTKPDGTGLGLASCYAITRNHGGSIKAEVAMQGGACFRIWLPTPTEADEATAQLQSRPRREQLYHGKGRIMVVDDERMIRQITCDMLTHLGYETESAADADSSEALIHQARDEGRPFKLYFFDLTLPGGRSGTELLADLRKGGDDTPAILSSGYCNNPVVNQHRNYGFSASVLKPYSIEQLSKQVDAVIRQSAHAGVALPENFT